jgi:hypothetical protein
MDSSPSNSEDKLMDEDIRPPHCFVCGRPEEEHEDFIETEDGLMCPECCGEIDDFEDIAMLTAIEEDSANDI